MTARLTIHIDMDDTIVDFSGGYLAARAANPSMAYPQAEYLFWENLAPISGAIECVKRLDSLPSVSTYLVTAPSIRNPLSYTGKRVWVERYFGLDFCERLIICTDKSMIIGDYLIDDYDEGKGQEKFCGELIHYGSSQFPDWAAVMEYINNLVVD